MLVLPNNPKTHLETVDFSAKGTYFAAEWLYMYCRRQDLLDGIDWLCGTRIIYCMLSL